MLTFFISAGLSTSLLLAPAGDAPDFAGESTAPILAQVYEMHLSGGDDSPEQEAPPQEAAENEPASEAESESGRRDFEQSDLTDEQVPIPANQLETLEAEELDALEEELLEAEEALEQAEDEIEEPEDFLLESEDGQQEAEDQVETLRLRRDQARQALEEAEAIQQEGGSEGQLQWEDRQALEELEDSIAPIDSNESSETDELESELEELNDDLEAQQEQLEAVEDEVDSLGDEVEDLDSRLSGTVNLGQELEVQRQERIEAVDGALDRLDAIEQVLAFGNSGEQRELADLQAQVDALSSEALQQSGESETMLLFEASNALALSRQALAEGDYFRSREWLRLAATWLLRAQRAAGTNANPVWELTP